MLSLPKQFAWDSNSNRATVRARCFGKLRMTFGYQPISQP